MIRITEDYILELKQLICKQWLLSLFQNKKGFELLGTVKKKNHFRSVKLWSIYSSSAYPNLQQNFYGADHLDERMLQMTAQVLSTEAKVMPTAMEKYILVYP